MNSETVIQWKTPASFLAKEGEAPYKFFISNYQRGYRWTEKQVKYLLNDLVAFAEQDKVDGVYSLQQLVVHKNGDCWETIDGQQRLTTLFIIFKCLGISDMPYEITYGSRQPPPLGNYAALIGNGWERDMDAMHLRSTYETVQEWIEEHTRQAEKLKHLLLQGDGSRRRVAFLWYQLAQRANRVEEFRNLNAGKVHLTPAELVKALFLRQRPSVAPDCQQTMALQWEQMENTLSAPDFWSFISTKTDAPEQRIGRVLCLASGQTPQSLFPYYESTLRDDNIHDMWQEVLVTFRRLEDWYATPTLYNWIGYLVHTADKGADIPALLCKEAGRKPRSVFRKDLRDMVVKALPQDWENVNFSKKGQVLRILLFLNIFLLNQSHKDGMGEGYGRSPAYKFPFNLYTANKWDIEHISSQAEDNQKLFYEVMAYHISTLPPEADQNALLQALNDGDIARLRDNPYIPHGWLGEKELEGVLKALETKNYDSMRTQMCDLLGPPLNDKHLLCNLTLLSQDINRSYKNAPFSAKRSIILKKVREGCFVPLATQMVFNKSYTDHPKNLLTWNDDEGGDADAYADFIGRQIDHFKQQTDI